MARADFFDTGSGYPIRPRALETGPLRADRATATDRPAWILFLPAPRRYVVCVPARDGTPGTARLLGEVRPEYAACVARRKEENNQLSRFNGSTTNS
jgi:hypothetical protein